MRTVTTNHYATVADAVAAQTGAERRTTIEDPHPARTAYSAALRDPESTPEHLDVLWKAAQAEAREQVPAVDSGALVGRLPEEEGTWHDHPEHAEHGGEG